MDPCLRLPGYPLDLARGEIPWAVVSAHLESLDGGAVLRRGFNYSVPDGLDYLREIFVNRFATCAQHVDETTVTGGALGALDLAFRAIRRDRPRARLVVLEPTYREALSIARTVGLPIVRWSELGGSLCSDDIVYVVPTYNNPDGRTMSAAERFSVASAVVAAGAALLEDAAYDLLTATSDERDPSVCAAVALQSDTAWYLRMMSFSKTVMPGARVCVVEGSDVALTALRSIKLDFGTSPYACSLIAELMRDPEALDRHIATITGRLEQGRDAAHQAFADWELPPSVAGAGYFIWLATGGTNSAEATARAGAFGVRVSDGAPFFVANQSTHLRLSMAWEPAERIHEACLRLEASVATLEETL